MVTDSLLFLYFFPDITDLNRVGSRPAADCMSCYLLGNWKRTILGYWHIELLCHSGVFDDDRSCRDWQQKSWKT